MNLTGKKCASYVAVMGPIIFEKYMLTITMELAKKLNQTIPVLPL